MSYILVTANDTAIEKAMMTEILGSDLKIQQEQYLIMKELFCIYLSIFL